MALSDRDCRHGRQIGKCTDCALDHMEMAADAEALIRQMLEAPEYHRAQTRPIDRTDDAITAGRARLDGKS